MTTNRLPHIDSTHPSCASLQNLNPRYKSVLSHENFSSDGENEEIRLHYQSPGSGPWLDDNHTRRSSRRPIEQGHLNMTHLSEACVTGVVSVSTTVPTSRTSFAETSNSHCQALAQNRMGYVEYLYQENFINIGSNRNSVQESFDLTDCSSDSSIRANNTWVYAGQPHSDLQALPVISNFKQPAAVHVGADKELPMDLVDSPSNFDVVMTNLEIDNDPLAFGRLSGYYGKKNGQQLLDCF